jgi:uncharacterized protein YjiS (DUF1127 family)
MIARLIDDVVSLLDRRYRARKIRIELEALSDKDLADIGLDREDICTVAKQAVCQQ